MSDENTPFGNFPETSALNSPLQADQFLEALTRLCRDAEKPMFSKKKLKKIVRKELEKALDTPKKSKKKGGGKGKSRGKGKGKGKGKKSKRKHRQYDDNLDFLRLLARENAPRLIDMVDRRLPGYMPPKGNEEDPGGRKCPPAARAEWQLHP